MHQPKQLQLFDFPTQPQIKVIHDPYWDELEAQADDIVEQAFLSINAKTEIIFDVDAETAHQHSVFVGEQLSSFSSPYQSVGEQVTSTTLKVAHQHDTKLYDRLSSENPTHWIEKYWVERGTNKYWYYRYTWMEVRKLHRVYIGSVTSNKAQKKKQAVEEAILDGQSPQEIKQLIRAFNN
jgi:hypothetical protein